MGLILSLIRLYLSIGSLLGIILLITQIVAMVQGAITATGGTIIDIVVAVLLRVILWAPQLWDAVIEGTEPFLTWVVTP